MGWFVYVLQCRSGRLYTGITTDVQARYAAHASGKGAKYTRADPPAKCLAFKAFSDRSTASKEEYRIKQLTRAKKLALVAEWAAD